MGLSIPEPALFWPDLGAPGRGVVGGGGGGGGGLSFLTFPRPLVSYMCLGCSDIDLFERTLIITIIQENFLQKKSQEITYKSC